MLVDDQALIRSGFRLILSLEDDIEVVGEASDGCEALEAARELRPDVVLMDVEMPVRDGIRATADVVNEGLGKVVILTTFDRDDYLFDALRAGASGFLLKNTDPEHLVEAVRRVATGDALLAPEVTMRVIAAMTAVPSSSAPPSEASRHASPATTLSVAHVTDDQGRDRSSERPPEQSGSLRGEDPRLEALTSREREVLTLVARGYSNAEIASELFLGEATVKTHVSNCLAKLHLRDRVQAVVLAYEAGLVTPGE
ncbi:MAG: response regulator transcription factor [Dermatophilus congolensis]|nr:response regulator transcription factor [Dermatophilus congolensis]